MTMYRQAERWDIHKIASTPVTIRVGVSEQKIMLIFGMCEKPHMW